MHEALEKWLFVGGVMRKFSVNGSNEFLTDKNLSSKAVRCVFHPFFHPFY